LSTTILPENAYTARSWLGNSSRDWKHFASEFNIYEKALAVVPTDQYDQAQKSVEWIDAPRLDMTNVNVAIIPKKT
jgi:hypothetical protein